MYFSGPALHTRQSGFLSHPKDVFWNLKRQQNVMHVAPTNLWPANHFAFKSSVPSKCKCSFIRTRPVMAYWISHGGGGGRGGGGRGGAGYSIIGLYDCRPSLYLSFFDKKWCCCWSLLYSAILRYRADSLRSYVILNEWLAFHSAFKVSKCDRWEIPEGESSCPCINYFLLFTFLHEATSVACDKAC